MARVLCVDPDDAARTASGLRDELSDLGIETETARSVDEAVAVVEADGPPVDCVVTGYELPDGTGLALVDRVRERAPDTGCILFTERGYDAIDTEAFQTTITEYVQKRTGNAIERLAQLVRLTVSASAQTSYPVPQNEAERIATLASYDLDAEGLEASLARITDLAARHFDVPTASINVIGEHSQEFLACHGTAESWAPTPREDSICTFTLVEDDPVMVVENVAEDPRFEHNEAFADLGIRTYMGANIGPEGRPPIGTLCVYDEEPHSFSEADRTYLSTLADVAMDLVDARARTNRSPEPDHEATEGGKQP